MYVVYYKYDCEVDLITPAIRQMLVWKVLFWKKMEEKKRRERDVGRGEVMEGKRKEDGKTAVYPRRRFCKLLHD